MTAKISLQGSPSLLSILLVSQYSPLIYRFLIYCVSGKASKRPHQAQFAVLWTPLLIYACC